MVELLTAFHLLVALVLVIVVLLQKGRGTDIAGAFGGMGSQTAFGPRGTATVLSKATVALAAIFMVTSITLAILANRGGTHAGSVLSNVKPVPTTKAPAPIKTQQAPAAPAAPKVQVTPVQPKAAPQGSKSPARSAPSPSKK